jgi:mRNA interferase RelE/StbE
MKWRVVLTDKAERDLGRLEKALARRIVAKLYEYESIENPLLHAKKLRPPFNGLYRFRMGQYRAIFEYSKQRTIHILLVLRVKHRKEAYE